MCAQVPYNENQDQLVGNGPIVKALVELEKYWDALEGDLTRETADTGGGGEREAPSRTEHRVNHHVRTSISPLHSTYCSSA